MTNSEEIVTQHFHDTQFRRQRSLDCDRFFSGHFGQHVVDHCVNPDGTRKPVPTCSDDHAYFYARLAGSYAKRVAAYQEQAEIGFTVVRGAFGQFGGSSR